MITLNGKQVKPTIFPDRTSQVWQLDADYKINDHINFVEWRFESEAELIHLHQLSMLLKTYNPLPQPDNMILNIPYLPYARQDKEISNETSFALWAFADILNQQGWTKIYVFDPHNPFETKRLIQRVVCIDPDLSFHTEYKWIIFPDRGAYDRYQYLVPLEKVKVGKKVRNQLTGRIEKYEIDQSIMNDGRSLVIDDLCDGGRTFVELGKLVDNYTHNLDLYVSHGLFSKGVDHLLKIYGKIITTRSCLWFDLIDAAKQSIAYNSIHKAINNGKFEFRDNNYSIKIGS